MQVSKLAKNANIGAHTKISKNAVGASIMAKRRDKIGDLEVFASVAIVMIDNSHIKRGKRHYDKKKAY